MKKRLLAAAVAAAITLSAGVVMAAPVQFDGDVQMHYRWNDDDADGKTEGAKATFRLNAKAALDAKTDFYARLAGQALTADNTGADFNDARYGTSVVSLDRLGLVFKGDNSTVNVGRQGATIGATALLYSTEGYLGNYMGSIDGVNAKTKVGATNLGLIAGKENGTDNKVYSLHGSYNPAEAWTVGGTLAKYDVDAADAINYWAVDAAYNKGKVGYFAEYAKSDADTKNKAYVFGTSYAFDAKNSLAVMYSSVDVNGDMGRWTDYDPNGKGMYYSYNHKLTNDTTFNVFYKDMEYVSDRGATDNAGDKYNSFRTTVTYKF